MKLNKKILMVGALLIAFTACNSDKKDEGKLNDKADTEVTESTKAATNTKNNKDNKDMIVNPPIENLEITYSSDENNEDIENESEVDSTDDN